MKGSLVVRKPTVHRASPRRQSSGIVLSEYPIEAPGYNNDFLDCHRRVYEYDYEVTEGEIANRRLQEFMVEVHWSHSGIRSWHRMSELEFLRLV